MFKIFNNFLTDKDLLEFEEIADRSHWKYTGFSINRDTIFWKMDINDGNFINNIMKKIETHMNKKFEVLRVYANGQTYGQDGDFHTDSDEEGAYTLLIYISEITPTNVKRIGGYTQFMLDGMIKGVEPYTKRAILFDSRIEHRGMAPLIKNILRVSLAFKLKEIK
jgi:hypothetical protein